MFKKIFSLLFAACFIFGTASAQSKNVEIDGDHGKLSAVIQTPANQKIFPLVIICHGFTGEKNSDLLKNLSDEYCRFMKPQRNLRAWRL